MACLTGALWPLQRQHDCPRSGETPIDPTCKRCEEGCAETFLRRHWLCAGNLFDHPNEAAKRAHQGLSRRAHAEAVALCGFGASSQLNVRQGCCRRRQQWSLEQEELLHLATSFETTRCIGIQTAAAANMAKMRGLSELVGVQLVSRARCLHLSEQRPGELCMDRSLESYRALIVRKFGPFFNCWSVLWAIWLLVRTAIILSSAFISDGGLARAASRMVTCGVESGRHSIAGAKSLSTRLGRMCWLLILLLNWLPTPGQVLWAMSLLTLLLRKWPFSMRSRLTWFEPSARLISWQSAYRSSFIPRPYRLSPN